MDCILGICLFSHIKKFFYSINPNKKCSWYCFQNRSIRCFHWSMINTHISNNMIMVTSCFFPFSINYFQMYVSVAFFIIIWFEINMLHFQLFFCVFHSFHYSFSIIALSYYKLLVIHKLVLFHIGHCIELTNYWFVLLLMLSFVH